MIPEAIKVVLTIIVAAALAVLLCCGVVMATQYIYRDELRASQQKRELEKYICDKAHGTIYYLMTEGGKKQRVCLTERGIVR